MSGVLKGQDSPLFLTNMALFPPPFFKLLCSLSTSIILTEWPLLKVVSCCSGIPKHVYRGLSHFLSTPEDLQEHNPSKWTRWAFRTRRFLHRWVMPHPSQAGSCRLYVLSAGQGKAALGQLRRKAAVNVPQLFGHHCISPQYVKGSGAFGIASRILYSFWTKVCKLVPPCPLLLHWEYWTAY